MEELESLEEQKKLKEYEEPEELKKLGKYPHRSFRETEKIFRQSIESEAGVIESAGGGESKVIAEILAKIRHPGAEFYY